MKTVRAGEGPHAGPTPVRTETKSRKPSKNPNPQPGKGDPQGVGLIQNPGHGVQQKASPKGELEGRRKGAKRDPTGKKRKEVWPNRRCLEQQKDCGHQSVKLNRGKTKEDIDASTAWQGLKNAKSNEVETG